MNINHLIPFFKEMTEIQSHDLITTNRQTLRRKTTDNTEVDLVIKVIKSSIIITQLQLEVTQNLILVIKADIILEAGDKEIIQIEILPLLNLNQIQIPIMTRAEDIRVTQEKINRDHTTTAATIQLIHIESMMIRTDTPKQAWQLALILQSQGR